MAAETTAENLLREALPDWLAAETREKTLGVLADHLADDPRAAGHLLSALLRDPTLLAGFVRLGLTLTASPVKDYVGGYYVTTGWVVMASWHGSLVGDVRIPRG